MTDYKFLLVALEKVLDELGDTALAVSGGIDSLTLAVIARRQRPKCQIFHAVSPAVPSSATQRVRDFARRHDWRLNIFDAGEFADTTYRKKPVNRCFFCKGNLYQSIAGQTHLPIASGTNLDDLDDFRPGLIAAKQHGVRHPYVSAKIDKTAIRNIARHLGLDDIADLPAAPCLSSRVRTGIPIEAQDLDVIERVEAAIQPLIGAVSARCRLTGAGFHIEIDAVVLGEMNEKQHTSIRAAARAELRSTDSLSELRPYKQGSAFVREGAEDG